MSVEHVQTRLAELTAAKKMKIDKDVPLPEKTTGGRPLSALGKLVREMEPGDSILLETQSLAHRARYLARYLKFKTTQRTSRDGTVRMWRME